MRKRIFPAKLDIPNLDVLVTIGAGDIDTLVGPIEEILKKERRSMRKLFKDTGTDSPAVPYCIAGISCQLHKFKAMRRN